MGLIGHRIIQSRTWEEHPSPPPPSLNYEYTFPITVFDAVRRSMTNEDSETLSDVITRVDRELAMKQHIIPGRPANYLMTYAGVPGGVGAIKISHEIPWKSEEQGHDRIPTEKAVGDFFHKMGLVDDNGDPIDPSSRKVRWSDIIGRPFIYDGLGNNDNGVMTQKAVTEAIKALEDKLTGDADDDETAGIITNIWTAIDGLREHVKDTNNPHLVTYEQVGAASKEAFQAHLDDHDNPHQVTKEQLGLENVDNTSDLDKPISTATRVELEKLLQLINNLDEKVDIPQYVQNITYDQVSGSLTLTFQDGSTVVLHIPINGLVDEITYDQDTKELVIYELAGEHRVSLMDLFVRYIGSIGTHIDIKVEETPDADPNIIHAKILPKSITNREIADGAITSVLLRDDSVLSTKIKNLNVTTDKIAYGAVTNDRLGNYAVTAKKIADHAITPRAMWTSEKDNQVLMVKKAGSDPVWSTFDGSTITYNTITNNQIVNNTITGDKIAHNTITNINIADNTITNIKIAENAITNNNVVNFSISGTKLVVNAELPGTPSITIPPKHDADNNEIPTTHWVWNTLKNYVFESSNLGNRIVDGSKLFTSSERNRALVVYNAHTDPQWGLINHDMMDDDAIGTSNIIDASITREKIGYHAIGTREIDTDVIESKHIKDGAIDLRKIAPASTPNRVLGVLADSLSPVYTTISRSMIDFGAIGTKQIEDHSVTLAKLEPSDQSNRILAVGLKNTTPTWTQITNPMLASRSVDTRVLASSELEDSVLAVHKPGTEPLYSKVLSGMIYPGAVQEQHISDGAIANKHLQEKIIESKNIMDWTIQSNNIAPHAITGIELFTSPQPNRVLAVTTMPYSNAAWLQVTTDMIEDEAISRDKLFRSTQPYRVLGVTEKGVPPEYLRITHQFIVDGTITSAKLEPNLVFYGTPTLVTEPEPNAAGFQIVNAGWVRRAIEEVAGDTLHGLLKPDNFWRPEEGVGVLGVNVEGNPTNYIMVDYRVIADGGITSGKLRRDLTLYGSPTLEIRPPADACDVNGNGDLIPDCQWVLDRIQEMSMPEFWSEIESIRVEDAWDLRGQGSTQTEDDLEITKERVHREWDDEGQGDLTPDNKYEIDDTKVHVEWDDKGMGDLNVGDDETYEPPGFLDPWEIAAIENGNFKFGTGSGSAASRRPASTLVPGDSSSNSSGVTGLLAPNSVGTDHLRKRAVTPNKMFTSSIGNTVLAVSHANEDAAFVKITSDLIENHSIQMRSLVTTNESNSILAVLDGGTSPEWTKISHDMLQDNIITTVNIVDMAITESKLADGCIGPGKLVRAQFIDDTYLVDGSVTNVKLADKSITSEKFAPGAITSDNIGSDLVFKGNPSVEETKKYEVRSMRNIIISPNRPSNDRIEGGCKNGDIWFQYL